MATAATAHAGRGSASASATSTTLRKAHADLFNFLPERGTLLADPQVSCASGAVTAGVSRAYTAGRRVLVRGHASGPGTWNFITSADAGVTWSAPVTIEFTPADRGAFAIMTPAVGTTHYRVTFTAPAGYPSNRVDVLTQQVG